MNCSFLIQAKLREVTSLEGHVLLKKLRDALEFLRGRLAGRNKEDVEKAISMVSFSYFFLILFYLSFFFLLSSFFLDFVDRFLT